MKGFEELVEIIANFQRIRLKDKDKTVSGEGEGKSEERRRRQKRTKIEEFYDEKKLFFSFHKRRTADPGAARCFTSRRGLALVTEPQGRDGWSDYSTYLPPHPLPLPSIYPLPTLPP
jgi:hypothetical protein